LALTASQPKILQHTFEHLEYAGIIIYQEYGVVHGMIAI
jgi:hypothetical protein